jgi:hypothetical protein
MEVLWENWRRKKYELLSQSNEIIKNKNLCKKTRTSDAY